MGQARAPLGGLARPSDRQRRGCEDSASQRDVPLYPDRLAPVARMRSARAHRGGPLASDAFDRRGCRPREPLARQAGSERQDHCHGEALCGGVGQSLAPRLRHSRLDGTQGSAPDGRRRPRREGPRADGSVARRSREYARPARGSHPRRTRRGGRRHRRGRRAPRGPTGRHGDSGPTGAQRQAHRQYRGTRLDAPRHRCARPEARYRR